MTNLQEIKVVDVMSVYSGKRGKCCCGCAGKHSYNSAHVEAGTKYRGYEVTPGDVNDKQVKRVLGIVQEAQKEDGRVKSDDDTSFWCEVGERLYIVRLPPRPNPDAEYAEQLLKLIA